MDTTHNDTVILDMKDIVSYLVWTPKKENTIQTKATSFIGTKFKLEVLHVRLVAAHLKVTSVPYQCTFCYALEKSV